MATLPLWALASGVSRGSRGFAGTGSAQGRQSKSNGANAVIAVPQSVTVRRTTSPARRNRPDDGEHRIPPGAALRGLHARITQILARSATEGPINSLPRWRFGLR